MSLYDLLLEKERHPRDSAVGSRFPHDFQHELRLHLRKNQLKKQKRQADDRVVDAELKVLDAKRRWLDAEEKLKIKIKESDDRVQSQKKGETENSSPQEKKKRVSFAERISPQHTRKRISPVSTYTPHSRSHSSFRSPLIAPLPRGRYVVAADQTRKRGLLSRFGSSVYNMFSRSRNPHGIKEKGLLRRLFGRTSFRFHGGQNRSTRR